MAFAQVTTEAVLSEIEDPGVQLIDIRSADAYNGWQLAGEPRGGHIPHARSLPAKWLNYLDWPDIVASKGLASGRSLILYGGTDEELETSADRFTRAGFADVRIYRDFATGWCADDALPLDRLPRRRNLVPPQWLRELLSTGSAPEYDNDRFVLCHSHYRNPGDYEEGHIPGAVAIDTNSLESTETWNRRSPEELAEALERVGITAATTVIVYGRFSFPSYDDPYPGSSAGHLGSIRCALIMMYAGVRDVRVLNGGLQSWLDAGLDTTTEPTRPTPADSFGTRIPARPELLVDTPEARKILRAENQNLISVRSWREIIGETSGYHYIQKKGRIPGAVFGNCGSDAYHMENYRNVDHTTREYPEIERMWKAAGITPDRRNVFYCGTGWRASEAFLNAWLMDYPDIAVYDGGWYEWSSDDSNPWQTGIPDQPQPLSSQPAE
ncbi:MAG: rhodanese-like domain-containing protein [Phycisphaerae bacterium]